MFGVSRNENNKRRLGLTPIRGLVISSIEKGPGSFSLNVLTEDFIVFWRV